MKKHKSTFLLFITLIIFFFLLSWSCNNVYPPDGANFYYYYRAQTDFHIFKDYFGDDGTGNNHNVTFNVEDKVISAFAGAKTLLTKANITPDLQDDADWDDLDALISYGVGVVGGDFNQTNWNFDYNYAILLGIQDVGTLYPLGPMVIGFTVPRVDQTPTNRTPAISFVLVGRINALFPPGNTSAYKGYDNARTIAYCTTHELGHARGILLDNSDIRPSHGGWNSHNCAMLTGQGDPGGIPDMTTIVFCADHQTFLSGIMWHPTSKTGFIRIDAPIWER